MKKLSNDLKRILNGLAYQDAGEFLTKRDKMKILGNTPEKRSKFVQSHQYIINPAVSRRIALISDGRNPVSLLDYAIDACQRHGAKIDLLLHGVADSKSIVRLKKRTQDAGCYNDHIQLGTKPVDTIIDYIRNHPSVIYLLAMPDDSVSRAITDDVMTGGRVRIPVPMVLIEDHSRTSQTNKSAA